MDFKNLNKGLEDYHAKLLKYRSTRDFENILKTLEESPTKEGSAATKMNYICGRSYALARLGRKKEAKETLNKLSELTFYYDVEQLQSVFNLISIFIEYDADELNNYQKAFILENMDNIEFPIHIKSTLFDLEDYINQ